MKLRWPGALGPGQTAEVFQPRRWRVLGGGGKEGRAVPGAFVGDLQGIESKIQISWVSKGL